MKQAPSLMHDHTFASVNEIPGTGTTTFDINVLVKVEEDVNGLEVKELSSQSSKDSQYSFMDATTSFNSLLEQIRNELRISAVYI